MGHFEAELWWTLRFRIRQETINHQATLFITEFRYRASCLTGIFRFELLSDTKFRVGENGMIRFRILAIGNYFCSPVPTLGKIPFSQQLQQNLLQRFIFLIFSFTYKEAYNFR